MSDKAMTPLPAAKALDDFFLETQHFHIIRLLQETYRGHYHNNQDGFESVFLHCFYYDQYQFDA